MNNTDNRIIVVNESMLKERIHVIRSQRVMLDFDLAEIYGYSTKAFNQQVKNNIDRFPDDFRFQLSREEVNYILRSKNLTSSWGGSRYLPYAFTEQGIYMLMSTLKGDLAVSQSIALVRLFKAMKDYLTENPGRTITFLQSLHRSHDRYIVLDEGTKDMKVYHCGASSKDAGKRITTITRLSDIDDYKTTVRSMLGNPVLQLR